MKYKDCVIDLAQAPGEILIANSLIKRFKKRNNIDFDLKINIDFGIDDSGVYYDTYPGEIFVNPDLAVYPNDIEDSKKINSYHGYVNDCSLLGNTIHEFAHFLCYKIYSGIIENYEKEFPVDRLFLCEYSNENVHEELAEIIRLYILNPFLLKLINEDVYKYLKYWFKSPNPTSQRHSVSLLEDYPIYIKKDLKNSWKIVHDVALNKIKKVG